MIYSQTKNFIFIPLSKCAGSSIHAALDPYSVRFSRSKLDYALNLIPFARPAERVYYRAHPTAMWVRQRLGAAVFDGAFSFAIVRNPFDRLVSRYNHIKTGARHHRHATVKQQTFKQFVQDEIARGRLGRDSQFAYLSGPGGRLLVKRIYRFENLEQDFQTMVQEIGLENVAELPQKNIRRRDDYRLYYDPETTDMVTPYLRPDLDAFGYAF